MKKMILLVLLILPASLWAESQKVVDIRDEMTVREFTEAGLDKLSPEEVDALNKWLNSFAGGKVAAGTDEKDEKSDETANKEKGSLLGSLFGGAKYKVYKIQKVKSDRSFRINKNDFTTSSVCPGYSEGDEVIFTEGRADGMCEEAEFSRPDGSDTCQVYCR